MAFNGSGTYVLPAADLPVSGQLVSATKMNSVFSDLATALTNAVCKDGQSTMTGALKMGGYNITGLSDGTKTLPSLAFSSNPDTGIYLSGASEVGVSINDTKILAVAAAGIDVTGTITTDLTGLRAVLTNASGVLTASGVTSTEVGYLQGVTSGIQAQIDAMPGAVTGAASTIVSANLTASKVVVSDGSGKVATSLVASGDLVGQTTSFYAPVVKFGSSTASGSFAGIYCKTGKLVNFSFTLSFSSLGSGGSGDALNISVPFTATGGYPHYGIIGWLSSVDSSVSALTLALDAGGGVMYVGLTASGASAYATKAKFTSSSGIYGSIAYLTDS